MNQTGKVLPDTRRVEPDRSGYLPVEGGARRIYWEYFGQGEKEVVVLLNGVGMLTRSWYRNVPNVFPDYDVLLYDYFGQGGSSQEDEPYYIDRFAAYLIGVMDQLGIDKVHPVGVSYGGFIAADLGRLFQDRLHTLTLSGILLTRETLFQMYQDISLMFYRDTDKAFEIYTHYLYEKTFGEPFAALIYGDTMERTRRKFYDRLRGPPALPDPPDRSPGSLLRKHRRRPRGLPTHRDSDPGHHRRAGSRHPALAAAQAARHPAQQPPGHAAGVRAPDLPGARRGLLAHGEALIRR